MAREWSGGGRGRGREADAYFTDLMERQGCVVNQDQVIVTTVYMGLFLSLCDRVYHTTSMFIRTNKEAQAEVSMHPKGFVISMHTLS